MKPLLRAIEQIDLTTVNRLIAKGIDVNQPCSNGQLSLVIAVDQLLNKDFNPAIVLIIDSLLKAGANPNVSNVSIESGYEKRQESLLHKLIVFNRRMIIFCGFEESQQENMQRKQDAAQQVISMLIQHGADLEVLDAHGNTPLLNALSVGNSEVAKLLLDANVSVAVSGYDGATPLHLACHHQLRELIDPFISKGVPINQQDNHSTTALDRAASHLDIALLLLQHNAQCTHHDYLYFLEEAERQQHTGLLDYLFAHGVATYKNKHGEAALHKIHSETLIQRLLKDGADVNAVTEYGDTPLLMLIKWSIPKQIFLVILKLLHNYHAKFAAVNKEKQTAIHIFIKDSCHHDYDAEILARLITYGTPINAQDTAGQTALHIAAGTVFLWDKMMSLIQHGINPNITDSNGLTALEKISFQVQDICKIPRYHAQSKEHITDAVFNLLRQYPNKLPINHADILHFAAYYNRQDIIEQLLARGINLSAYDVLSTAVMSGHGRLMAWLLKHDVDVKKSIALQKAVMHLDFSMTQQLIDAGAEPYFELLEELIRDFNVRTIDSHVLEDPQQKFAATANIFKLLLEKQQDKSKYPILLQHITIQLKHVIQQVNLHHHKNPFWWPFAKHLISLGCKCPNDLWQQEVLINCAMQLQDYDILIQLIIRANPELKTSFFQIAAKVAIDNDSYELLKWLVEQGLDVNSLMPYGDHKIRLIEYAVMREKPTVTHCLITNGANVHFPSYYMSTLLHTAVNLGWTNVVELLLQPQYHFPVDLIARRPPQVLCCPVHLIASPITTALQIAIEQDSEELVHLLLKYKAGCRLLLPIACEKNNLKIIQTLVAHNADLTATDEDNRLSLHIACQKGNIAAVKLLIKAGADVNAQYVPRQFAFGMPWAPLHCMLSSNSKLSGEITLLLIQNGASIDTMTIRLAIAAQIDAAVINKMLNLVKSELVGEAKLLHLAVAKNRADIVHLLLSCYREVIVNSRDVCGRTALHIAAQQGDKVIFDMLMAAGADISLLDYDNNSVAIYALYYDTQDELAIDISGLLPVAEFNKLRVNLIESPEFAEQGLAESELTFRLSCYCYKLICLFGTADEVLEYIAEYSSKTSHQPVHDLCLFNLPSTGNWHKSAWARLAHQHGSELTKYLNLVPRIEALLNRAPQCFEEVVSAACQIKYNRDLENPELAALFIQHQIPETAFIRVLDNYQPKYIDNLPNLYIDGADISEPCYYLKKLVCNDLRGFVLGAITHCCQSMGSAGEACAWHGMTSLYGGFYALFKRNPKEIGKLNRLLDIANTVDTFDKFIAELPDKCQRRKYRELKGTLNQDDPLTALKAKLITKLQSLQEGELIAQTWAWLSKQSSLVFDSWERLRPEDNRLCQVFLREAAKQAILQYKIPKVLLGKGGNTPESLSFTINKNPEYPVDYIDYRDSGTQFIIASQESLPHDDQSFSGTSIAADLVRSSSVFAKPPTESQSYTPDKMMELLTHYSKECSAVILLPFITQQNLGAQKELSGRHVANDHVLLQPIYKQDQSWACLVIIFYSEPIKNIIYLDPVAEQSSISYKLADILKTTSIAETQAAYIQNPVHSGPWLIEVIRNLLKTGRVVTPPLEGIDQVMETHQTLFSQLLNHVPGPPNFMGRI
jgi:ankyrin repeat protein